MGTTAFILTDREKYTPERFLAYTIIATFHADAKLIFENHKVLEEGRFSSTTLNVLDHSYRSSENNHQFILYVKGRENHSIAFSDYDDLGLNPDYELSRVGTIEEVYGAEKVIFRFIYEYLKINPNDYFWVADYDWVYSWEDMRKLKSLPYDPNWCYKNPKTNL
ncbi:hypothetical protein [Paenibacillus faecalis]|uniref:hypothetical protein n=1 Tax=Paenibacillus faecalis TaxID=2079532 RepID=UPI000D0F77C7|nr:hypothetical protein [Paenibacillus faecalis]